MARQLLTIEWIVAESDDDWDRLATLTHPDKNLRRRRSHSRWVVAGLFLLLVGIGSWVWPAKQVTTLPPSVTMTVPEQQESGKAAPDLDSLRADLSGALSESPPGGQSFPKDSAWLIGTTIQAPATSPYITIPTLEMQGDTAVALVVMHSQYGTPLFRQTRFFRYSDNGWQETEPDVTLWGPERSLETPNFLFRYLQNDESTVKAIAPQIETLYTTLHRNFGLLMVPAAEKLLIEISVAQNPGNTMLWYNVPDRIIVPSPARYRAPAQITDAKLLEQSIALALLEIVLTNASQEHAIGESWQHMLDGLLLWQLWAMDEPLSAWRGEIVQWLYSDFSTDPGVPLVLPDHYAELCAGHKLWLASPVNIGIPFVCGGQSPEELHWAGWRRYGPLTRLDQILVPLQQFGGPTQPPVSHPGQTVAIATLIEYAVATFGRERMPHLGAGLGQYKSWETLITAVYGVSIEEFEAGWQAYLTSQYGIPSMRNRVLE